MTTHTIEFHANGRTTRKSFISFVGDDECCKQGYTDACDIVAVITEDESEDEAEVVTEVVIEDESDDD